MGVVILPCRTSLVIFPFSSYVKRSCQEVKFPFVLQLLLPVTKFVSTWAPMIRFSWSYLNALPCGLPLGMNGKMPVTIFLILPFHKFGLVLCKEDPDCEALHP